VDDAQRANLGVLSHVPGESEDGLVRVEPAGDHTPGILTMHRDSNVLDVVRHV
jgi:hypothetical protein